MNEYLTTQELSSRIKIAPQTLYNKKSQGEFKKGYARKCRLDFSLRRRRRSGCSVVLGSWVER